MPVGHGNAEATVGRALVIGLAAAAAATVFASSALPAEAGVRIGSKRVVVKTKAGEAVVQRGPFRITFKDARGNVLLRERDRRPSKPKRLPETSDPEPLGGELRPDRATYAPLSFEVGTHKLEQWNALLWTGNVLFSRRKGTVHFPRRVVSARPLRSSAARRGAGNDGTARGVRLRVATTDRKRDLIVSIAPDGRRALRVVAKLTNGDRVITIGDSFDAGRREGFYGFGGRHGSVNKRGEKLFNYTEQSNFGGPETLQAIDLLEPLVELGSDYTLADFGNPPTGEADLPGGYERYLVPNGMNATYYPQAQFLSSRGYGFLLNRNQFARWRMANDRGDAWQVQTAARKLDYSVALGPDVSSSMTALTAITGRHLMPPRWAQGPTLWRAIQVPAAPGAPAVETPEDYKAKVEQDLADIEAYDIDVSAYAFEGWAIFDDLDYVRDVIDRLHAMGIRAILYHRAYVANDSLSSQPKGDYEETLAKGLVAKTAAGDPYIFGANGGGDSTLLDFTNPDTKAWWRERLELTLELGMDGFMQDFGEQVQDDMHFANGKSGRNDAQPLSRDLPSAQPRDPRPVADGEPRPRQDLVLHALGLQRPARKRRLRDGDLPGRRDNRVERRLGTAIAGPRHAQPRPRRRLRLQHRHRWLRGLHRRAAETRSCSRAGASGQR